MFESLTFLGFRKKRRRYRRRQPRLIHKFEADEAFLFMGDTYKLRVVYDKARKQGCQIDGEWLEVNLHGISASREVRCQEISLELMLWYKRQANIVLKERLDYWREKLDVKYRRFIVNKALRCWGSCNRHDDIRLNWRLIMAPVSLIDYVAAHELCHVVHKNHSRHFWNLVESVIPQCKQRHHELRALSTVLHL